MKLFVVSTKKKDEILDITEQIEQVIQQEKISGGVCSLTVLHTTCALTTADLDPGTDLDFLDALRKILPHIEYRHPHNPLHTPDHILSSIIGTSVTIPFQNQQLILGMWQRIILVELDGPKERSIAVSFLKE